MTETQQQSAPAGAADNIVILRREGRLGHIQLNRPRAINALTHDMVVLIQAALDGWKHDPSVTTIVLTGSGERGLCAGGDIVAMYHDAIEGGGASAAFWADEYRLNASIAEYPKPFVAIMDGIVLGGGIGLSAHADIRIVTERSSIGMPETSIGFLPDVGGTFLLSHAPGELGTHLGLTAGTIRAGDAIAIGMADWYVPTERLEALVSALATTDPLVAVAEVAEPPPESPLLHDRSWIDELYRGEDTGAIVARLASSRLDQARATAQIIETKSPTAVTVTLTALRRAREMTNLRQALDQEFRLAVRLHRQPDFIEGVRAQVIDKDRNPRWSPQSLSDVGSVETYFDDLGAQELRLANRLH